MKNRDIKGGKGPSTASDEATEKLAKEWKPKSIYRAAQTRKEDCVKSKWFRAEADELEKKAYLKGFDSAVSAISQAAYENRRIGDRIKEWKDRCGAE